MRAEDVTLILLAAGEARRFGGDKLMAMLNGRQLAAHATDTLSAFAFRERIAVVSRSRFDFAALGYRIVRNDAPEAGQARSLRLGIETAGRCDAVLIALADMPRIGSDLVARLLAAAIGPSAIVAASDGNRVSPPALIGADHFGTLRHLDGDVGARALIRGGIHVAAAAGQLADVDTAEALAVLAATDATSAR